MGAQGSQKGTTRNPTGKRNPKGAKRVPRGTKREPKGYQREPEESQRKPKGARREPKGSQKGANEEPNGNAEGVKQAITDSICFCETQKSNKFSKHHQTEKALMSHLYVFTEQGLEYLSAR